MAQDIRKVNDIESLMTYFSENLGWDINPDDYYDIDDITYDFEAADLGLKEEAFAKITSLKQLRPLVDDQRWGIFFVNFESNRFEVSALRKILSGLIPARRNADHAVWDKSDLLFLCTWGQSNKLTIGAAHFEDSEKGLPQIKMISCEPAVEDFTQIRVFEQRLAKLAWPKDTSDVDAWHDSWSSAFTTRYRQAIQDSHTLTVRLAEEAQNIRDRILATLEIETTNGYVHLLFEKFRNTLVHDMTEQQFADMYAQTVVYGLFSARCMDNSQEDFNASEAVECIPNTNPFLKGLLQECLGSNSARSKLSFDELEVGNIVDLLLHTQTDSIITDFNRQTGGGREDPVIHFYEEFLSEYDKSQRVQRGVYYTPQPVVNFIVRAVDDILKRDFGVADGLASTETKKIKYMRQSKKRVNGLYRSMIEDEMDVPAIQILDPATGTGTFLRQSILQIYDNFCSARKGMPKERIQAEWNQYVPEHLLPRLNGFELMMAPYAVAHMKLAMILKDTGYLFESEERLKVFLTNTLEKPGNSEAQLTLFDDPLAFESVAANKTKKDNGINIILGNPPYLSASTNASEYVSSLMEVFKLEPGGKIKLQERKNWLNDDYVKFLRYAEEIVLRAKSGIIAFINPHGWLENGGFRGMRWRLLSSFDTIYIINLHGNSKKGETAPDGGKDENVFDIQQGVCINIFVKKPGGRSSQKLAEVKYVDLYGQRDDKYAYLTKTRISECQWETLTPEAPKYFLIPRDFSNAKEYEQGFRISEVFTTYSQGIMSGNDAFVMLDSYEDVDTLLQQARTLADRKEIESLVSRGRKLPKNWSLKDAIDDIIGGGTIERVQYRPFDSKYTVYTGKSCGWLWRPRTETMNLLCGENDNIAINVTRIVQKGSEYHHVFVSDCITDKGLLSSKDNAFVFPLYRYGVEFGKPKKYSNFTSDFLGRFESVISLPLNENKDASDRACISSLDILAYIYGMLHSQKYCEYYRESLITEFPKVAYPQDTETFWVLSECGYSLINAHLMRTRFTDATQYVFSSDKVQVDRVEYKNGEIRINKECVITDVPKAVWDYLIGSYQPAEKWLKDRKGTVLTQSAIEQYKYLLQIIEFTLQMKEEIDKHLDY